MTGTSLILEKVLVNGKVITELGTKVLANDIISIDGVIINKDVNEANKNFLT